MAPIKKTAKLRKIIMERNKISGTTSTTTNMQLIVTTPAAPNINQIVTSTRGFATSSKYAIMDVTNSTTEANELFAASGLDSSHKESQDNICGEKSVAENMDTEDIKEIEDDSVIQINDAEPQVAEKIEIAVVTCAKDDDGSHHEKDVDSSLEVFFDVENEIVDESTKVELQIEINKSTNENNDQSISIKEITEEIKIAEEEKKEENKLTNGNASPEIIENEESALKPETSINTLNTDDIVILSDDEVDAEAETEAENTKKALTNDENNKEKDITEEIEKNKDLPAVAVASTEEEKVAKISAIAEIMEDSNNSDSSNLLEISTVQEEREKERLQEKSGEEDEEYEEEDVEAEADAEVEVEDEETVHENDIEVVESNIENDTMCSPPAKRSKLSDVEREKKDVEEEENTLTENIVELTDKNELVGSEETNNNNNKDVSLNTLTENTAAEEEKSESIEMEVEAKIKDNVVTTTKEQQMENGIEMSYSQENSTKSKESVPLQFLRKFKKRFENMNRTDLEEFVTQKIIETIIYKSQFSELNKQLKIQEQITERHRNNITELSKQLRDLNMVHNRVLKDLEEHYSQIVLPVKITRAVGLQVCIPKRSGDSSTSKKEQQQQTSTNNQEKENNIYATHTLVPNTQPQQQPPQQQQQQQQQQPLQRAHSLQKLNKSQSQTDVLNRTTPSFQQTFFDANKPSTSKEAKEAASLQIRKMQATTSTTTAEIETGKVTQNSNKKQSSSTKEVLPTTSIPASVYNMQTYMSSLGQSGAITITAAKPKEKDCIDLTEDDDCVVLPITTKDPAAPAITSHILNTSQVYRQRNNVQPQQQQQQQLSLNNTKNNVRNYRLPNTTNNNLNATNAANAVARKNQASNIAFLNQNRNVNANTNNAPPLVMIPANTHSLAQTALKRKLTKHLHPAPLPYMTPPILKAEWKKPPPKPSIRINTAENGGIVISWTMDEPEENFAECVSYQIYAYQQTTALPQTDFWRYVGDVKAMLLPMAVTLTQFQEGQRYFFAVRAVDVHKRYGPFSAPKTWA